MAGRIVNAYTDAESDYVLAFLSRVALSTAAVRSFGVAGLQPVEIPGIENVQVEGVEGHVSWRGICGRCLMMCGARGIDVDEAEAQERFVGGMIRRELEEASENETSKTP